MPCPHLDRTNSKKKLQAERVSGCRSTMEGLELPTTERRGDMKAAVAERAVFCRQGILPAVTGTTELEQFRGRFS